MDSSDKKCPYCAETIKAEAIRCKHCQVSLLTGTADGAPPPKAKKSIWPWLILTPLLLLGALMVIGAMSGPPDEKSKARAAIDLCWEGVDDELQSLSTRRFIRGTCQMMVEKFEANYGPSPSLRRD